MSDFKVDRVWYEADKRRWVFDNSHIEWWTKKVAKTRNYATTKGMHSQFWNQFPLPMRLWFVN